MNRKGVEVAALVALVWFISWLLLDSDALPNQPWFPVTLTFVASMLGGFVQKLRIGSVAVPGLLGMILVGAILRNSGALDGLKSTWNSSIRTLALGVILTRGGLVLDLSVLRSQGRSVLLLSALPCLASAVTHALVAKALTDMPWVWCLMLGFILAPVSPAVIVPNLTELQVGKYGTAKGVPSMLLAATGVDVVVAVTGYGVCYGLTFDSSVPMSIAKGPIGIVGGVIISVIAASLFAKLFDSPLPSDGFKAASYLLAGLSCMVGSYKYGYSGGGALATMLTGALLRRWTNYDLGLLTNTLAAAWELAAKPLLFGLIGAAIDMDVMTGQEVLHALGIFAAGLAVRLVMVQVSLLGTNLNLNERMFIMLCWLAKATVQAALGPSVLDHVQKQGDVDPEEESWGQQILITSVVAIIIAAPIGAGCIEVFGTKLLEREDLLEGEDETQTQAPMDATVEIERRSVATSRYGESHRTLSLYKNSPDYLDPEDPSHCHGSPPYIAGSPASLPFDARSTRDSAS
ncbi:hypothetical protein DIPPA_14705 [Diplonema papillatum]|nr:hypothetical protein DIPPA_14705 [Diplonema papillatum]